MGFYVRRAVVCPADEAHLSERQIAHGCRISRSTVQRYLERAAAANLGWPLPESLDDGQLERLLFPPQPGKAADESHLPPKAKPDFAKIHHELKANKSVTLQLLWQEFVEQHPDAVHYSWFCEQYRAWARHLDVVLRQEHRAGEKTFVDHAGDTIQSDRSTQRTDAGGLRVRRRARRHYLQRWRPARRCGWMGLMNFADNNYNAGRPDESAIPSDERTGDILRSR